MRSGLRAAEHNGKRGRVLQRVTSKSGAGGPRSVRLGRVRPVGFRPQNGRLEGRKGRRDLKICGALGWTGKPYDI